MVFSLESGAPSGASIDPASGLFTWATTEADGPNSYPVTVTVTDNGDPSRSDSELITITVNEVNEPPVLDPIGDQVVIGGQNLSFTAMATDTDLPPNNLVYSISGEVPAE